MHWLKCIHILDGIYINAHIPYKKRTFYQNRKSTLSQNVLAVVTLNLCYYYVLLGWERSAHNSRVLTDKVVNQKFSVLEKKYYLSNTGYCNFDYAMIPYQGI